MLRALDIAFGYGDRRVLEGATIAFAEGSLCGIVGPNGAGKSTLLKCLYGALTPRRGTVHLGDSDLHSTSRREVARAIGVVPQHCHPAFPVPVEHFVGQGRFAHRTTLLGPSPADRAVVRNVLVQMGLEAVASRSIDALSGGEFRRVLIAQALAQEPRILLFDEPVQQLDLLQQIEVMEFARSFARRGGTCAAVVLHDLGLAARYCDTIALLDGGRIALTGTAEQVFTTETIRRVWNVDAAIERSTATGAIQVIPLGGLTPRNTPRTGESGGART